MKRSRKQPDTGRPEELADRSRDYAPHMMRTVGSVPPTGIADTDEGHVFRMPAEVPDDRAKDRFAEGARMFAVAVRARAPAMIAEAWVRLPFPVNFRPFPSRSGRYRKAMPPPLSPPAAGACAFPRPALKARPA